MAKKKKRIPLIPLNDQNQKVFFTEYRVFRNLMKSLGYQKPGATAVSVDVVQEGLKNPKRVNLETALHQDRYEYFSRTGYSVVLYPGIIDNTFGKKLSVFVMIRDKKEKRVWIRQFHRFSVQSFFTLISAYAQAAKNAVDARPTHGPRSTYMRLVEKNITCHVWKQGREERTFDICFSTDDSMSSGEMNAIFNKEHSFKKYFDKYRTAKEFMRDIRKKWD